MKKFIILILSWLVLMGCSNNHYETTQIKLGEIDFDGEIITFYHEQIWSNEIQTGSHYYYQTESSKEKMDGILFSKDGSLKLFVDFEGNQEVLDEANMIVEPFELLYYGEMISSIYVLKTDEVYHVRFKAMNDYSFCLSSEASHVSIELDLQLLKAQIENWLKLEDCSKYASSESFDLFLEIIKNRREVGELIRAWSFGKVELDDGRWIVFIREDEREYYLLEIEQVDLLKKLISKQ